MRIHIFIKIIRKMKFRIENYSTYYYNEYYLDVLHIFPPNEEILC